jgi:1,4-dihydroxy-6-naphthoate synthase
MTLSSSPPQQHAPDAGTRERVIRVGHSPDPDDAFMFYGLSSGKVKLEGITIEHLLEDIQSLNARALKGELEVTAISAHAYAFVADRYWIMATGASMGEGYGPVLISKKYRTLEELRGKRVATPGKLTTATLLFKIFTDGIDQQDVPFDRIMALVENGGFDAGVIIHEGQITYQKLGFNKILDFGELWGSIYRLPLPLGLDVVRKDLGQDLASQLSSGLKQSIHYGYTHQNEAIPYALRYGRGINRDLGEKFVKMYVSELTVDMGSKGRQALELLYRLAAGKGLIPNAPEITLY